MSHRNRAIHTALFALALGLSAGPYAQPHDATPPGSVADPLAQSVRHWSNDDHTGQSDSVRQPDSPGSRH